MGAGGVDELLVQFDRGREPWWAVQDAGLDVVALCDTGGTPTSHFPNGTARVVAQFGYDAYGSVVTAESLFAHALLRAGHKGLFFDRLDLGVADPLTLDESPRLAVGADLLGNARNRVYSPRLGRWVQRDPNASGSTSVVGESYMGDSIVVAPDEFDLSSSLIDGPSLYAFLRANPGAGSDPLGLFMGYVGFSMSMGYDAWSTASGALEEARQGLALTFWFKEYLARNRIDQVFDSSWASDWSQDDSSYSQNGISGQFFASGTPEDEYTYIVVRRKPGFPAVLAPFAKNRQHGGNKHWSAMRQAAKQYFAGAKFKSNTLRTNQALVDDTGQIVKTSDGKIRRPDIQVIDNDGKVHIIEVGVSQSSAEGRSLETVYKEVLGDRFGSYLFIKPP